jgi:hypothetical protein
MKQPSIESVILKTPEYLNNLCFRKQDITGQMPEGTNFTSVGTCLSRMVKKEMLTLEMEEKCPGSAIKIGHYKPTGKEPLQLKRSAQPISPINIFLRTALVTEPSPTEFGPKWEYS